MNVLKVNKVHKDGPAEEHGLQAESDFIIGAKPPVSTAQSKNNSGITEFENL